MNDSSTPMREAVFDARSGWPVLTGCLVAAPVAITVFGFAVAALDEYRRLSAPEVGMAITGLVLSILLFIATVLFLVGLFIVNPNEARVLVLFGRYRGTVRRNGFFWTNPFTVKKRVSLKARNLNGEKLKVNDRNGNPIEIAAVVVWRVRDTAQALFDVDDYIEYVQVQSESAVRQLATVHPYDSDDDQVSLRGSTLEVAAELQRELQERLDHAGVEVIEARLTHLAYAPEIAGAMLQRQQADAIIAARQKIVDGAVSMVQMAIEKLRHEAVIELDEERKAAMVSNLLVVLCSEHASSPVVNVGTLYQ